MANTIALPAMRLEIDVIIATAILAAYTIFAVVTFHLLWTRKRPKADTTTLFWRTAMLSLAACGPVWLAQTAGAGDLSVALGMRSEDRGGGKACVSTCRARWSPSH